MWCTLTRTAAHLGRVQARTLAPASIRTFTAARVVLKENSDQARYVGGRTKQVRQGGYYEIVGVYTAVTYRRNRRS